MNDGHLLPMKILKNYIVDSNSAGIRLQEYLIEQIDTIPSKKGIQKLIKRKNILVNNEASTTGYRVKEGDVVHWIESERPLPAVFQLPIPIIYEDEHLAVINKPAGIAVSGNQHRTIKNALPFNLTPSHLEGALRRPLPVHRLDGPTSGLLLVAKTSAASVHLSRQFQERSIKKEYLAVAMGKLSNTGTINNPLDNKEAITKYEVLQTVPSLRSNFLSSVRLLPETGRTHQLRRHLAGVGCPILGDALYGREGEVLKHKGLFLCAMALSFAHPISKQQMEVRMDPPSKFQKRMESEALRWQRYHGQ